MSDEIPVVPAVVPAVPVAAAQPAVAKPAKPAAVVVEDDEDEGGDEKLRKVSQVWIDNTIQRRLSKQAAQLAAKHDADVLAKDALIASLQSERDGYLTAATATLKTTVDALPAEVKELMPGDLTTSAGLKQVEEWLPKATALAAKLATASRVPPETPAVSTATAPPAIPAVVPTVVPPVGNGGNPPPADQSKVAELDAVSAKDHPIWASF